MTLPRAASVAYGDGDAKLVAPAAVRNAPDIVSLIHEIAPAQGSALEIASGTGQHVVALADALPTIDWQPSEIDPDRLTSIAAYVAEARLGNLRLPLTLDAAVQGWAAHVGPFEMIHTINLLHLIPARAAQTILEETAQALAPGGRLMIYGPFTRDGKLTSEGDARFDAQLRAADPAIGYKDDTWMKERLTAVGLTLTLVREMPANNLAFVASKGFP